MASPGMIYSTTDSTDGIVGPVPVAGPSPLTGPGGRGRGSG